MEAFNSIFGQHMRANRLDLITITELEDIVNTGTDAHYSRAEITFLLEVNLIFKYSHKNEVSYAILIFSVNMSYFLSHKSHNLYEPTEP